MYFVVSWDDWSTIIPASWLILQSKSFKWPPKDKNPSVESIKSTLPDKNWHIISYKKYLGPFGKYYLFLIYYNIFIYLLFKYITLLKYSFLNMH